MKIRIYYFKFLSLHLMLQFFTIHCDSCNVVGVSSSNGSNSNSINIWSRSNNSGVTISLRNSNRKQFQITENSNSTALFQQVLFILNRQPTARSNFVA